MEPTDVVVVLPGIMGSTLRRGRSLVWAPSAGSALRAIGTFGDSIKSLQLPEDIGDDHPQDGVEPAGLMPDLHVLPGIWTPVKGYDRLLARLRSLGYREPSSDPDAPPGNLLAVPYDWRLSNRCTGARLADTVEPALERWRAQGGRYADARLVFVCHSMGGLVARWYIEHCGGAAHTRKLITFGTPYRGAAKALAQLAGGVEPRIGPLSVDLTGLTRSLPSLYQLLPEYACIEREGKLLKTTETSIPDLRARDVRDGMSFHLQLREAESRRPESLEMTHTIVGINQSTTTTARIDGGRVDPLDGYLGEDLYGDATVPLVGACRADVPMDSNTLRRISDKHGNLHRNDAALDELEAILTARPIKVRAAGAAELRVDVPDLIISGNTLQVEMAVPDQLRVALTVSVRDEAGRLLQARTVRIVRGAATAVIEGLIPGAYTIDVDDPGARVTPVSSTVLVWPAT